MKIYHVKFSEILEILIFDMFVDLDYFVYKQTADTKYKTCLTQMETKIFNLI